MQTCAQTPRQLSGEEQGVVQGKHAPGSTRTSQNLEIKLSDLSVKTSVDSTGGLGNVEK